MEAYTGFAQVYDKFMDNVPYDKWAEDIRRILINQGISEGILLDLGCGTGNITRRFAGYGYDMIGIDRSEEMLQIAIEKKYEEELAENSKARDILYLKQDMRNFELYGTVSAIICICDSLNYITKEEELLSVFSLVNNYLEAGGIFLFDMNTEYKYKEILSENVIAENREDCSFIWENYFDEKENINEYQVTIFVEAEAEEDNRHQKGRLYEKFSEMHYQKAYSVDTVKSLLEKAGMEFIGVYEAFSENPPKETAERVCFLAREKFQEGKVYR
jgi:SAM-dependent methyltransferase